MLDVQIAYQWGAFEIWESLTQGEWALVRCYDLDGRRYLQVRPCLPGQASPALRQGERRVASLAQQGLSSKQIAYELGVSPAAVSRQLGCALRKLGLRNASELSRGSSEWLDAEPPSGVGALTRRSYRLLPPPGLEASSRSEQDDHAILSFPLLRRDALGGLSPVELEVVKLLVSGYSVPEVARARGRSRHTVDNQVRTIYAKLGIASRQELVKAALG